MFKVRTIGILATGVALSGAAVAQEMRCGEKLISGNQVDPLLEAQVLELCGEPTARNGFNWYYQEQGKILVFNDSGELDHIKDANEE